MRYAITILIIALLIGCSKSEEIAQPVEEPELKNENTPVKKDSQPDPKFLEEHPEGVHYSVDLTGEDMQQMTFLEVAELWEINPEDFVINVKEKLSLKNEYSSETKIVAVQEEVHKPWKSIKDVAEEMKQEMK